MGNVPRASYLTSDIHAVCDRLGPRVKDFAGKTILLTGAHGFLGRYLVAIFQEMAERLARPCHVVAMDNFISSADESRPSGSAVTFIKHNVIDEYPAAALHRRVDFVIPAAGLASPAYYKRFPLETIDVTTIGLRRALDVARDHHARLLYFSSSEIYGDPVASAVPTPETYKGNVASLGPRACYDDQSEILTENGWVLFKDLDPTSKVATLGHDGRVEYHVPNEHIVQDYEGSLLAFQNSKIDAVVTGNHFMYVRDKADKMRFLAAQDIDYARSWRVPVSGQFAGREVETKFFEKKISKMGNITQVKMDDWLEFVGYYISEGCAYTRKTKTTIKGKSYDTKHYSIQIAQSKEEGRQKISACLERLGFNYFDSDDHAFRVCSKYLVEMFRPLGHSRDKYIPREYMDLSARQSRILLDALILGDGHRRGDSTAIYYSMSRRLADDVQELALRCGLAATISQSSRGLYAVNIRPPVFAKLPFPEKYPYTGKVYCVDVTNHVICVRRSGKAFWCGNCYDESKRLGETLCYTYAEKFGTAATMVRPFNVFGPGLSRNDLRVIPNFGSRIIDGKPIEVYGTGRQTRTFCYVVDAMVGFLLCLLDGKAGEAYNVGNPEPEISMVELVPKLAAILGKKVDFRVIDYPANYPADEPMRRCPDITKARALGYEPLVPLDEGLRRFFHWAEQAYLFEQPA